MNIEKIILELRKITGLSRKEIIEKLEGLKSKPNTIKNFYLFSGRFPKPKEDEFLHSYGFKVWESAVKSKIFNRNIKNP